MRLRDGERIPPDRLTELDDRVELATIIDVGAAVLAGICFVVWFHRAIRNLKAMGRSRYGPGWAIAGWLIPFLNLVRPMQMMNDLVRGSARNRVRTGVSAPVGTWWVLFVATMITGNVLASLTTDTVASLIRWDTVHIVVEVVWIVTGLLLLRIVTRVTGAQDAWFDEPRSDAVVP